MNQEVLSTPLHGIYIPFCMLMAGIAIVFPRYLHYGILLGFILGFHKIYRASYDDVKEVKVTDTTSQFCGKRQVSMGKSITYFIEYLLPRELNYFPLKPGQYVSIMSTDCDSHYEAITLFDEDASSFYTVQSRNGLILETIRLDSKVCIRGPLGDPIPIIKEKSGFTILILEDERNVGLILQILDEIVNIRTVMVYCLVKDNFSPPELWLERIINEKKTTESALRVCFMDLNQMITCINKGPIASQVIASVRPEIYESLNNVFKPLGYLNGSESLSSSPSCGCWYTWNPPRKIDGSSKWRFENSKTSILVGLMGVVLFGIIAKLTR